MTANDARLARIVSDPCGTVIVMEHRDRLARLGVEHLRAALAAQGGRMRAVRATMTIDHAG